MVSTHSHPKVAASLMSVFLLTKRFQHTATRRWLPVDWSFNTCLCFAFQHTATRRWLQKNRGTAREFYCRFNTQPPEGGCGMSLFLPVTDWKFQHTATRRWLQQSAMLKTLRAQFQHTATRRWLPAQARQCRRLIAMFQHTATRRWLRPI